MATPALGGGIASAAAAVLSNAVALGGRDPSLRKRRIVLTYGYLGTNFFGSQYNEQNRATENLIEEAACRLGLLDPRNQKQLHKIGWNRTSRTDKGVHAVANTVSFKVLVPESSVAGEEDGTRQRAETDLVTRFNSLLPQNELRVAWIQFTSRSFQPRKMCVYRKYQYLLPHYFAKSAGLTAESVDAWLKKHYLGTKNFANFCTASEKPQFRPYQDLCTRLGFEPPAEAAAKIGLYPSRIPRQSDRRTIFDIGCSPTENGTLVVTIVGSSFMYNQIRKMIGMLVADLGGHVDRRATELALTSPFLVSTPVAPGFPLLLDFAHFTNKKDVPDYITLTERDLQAMETIRKELVYPGINNLLDSKRSEFEEFEEMLKKGFHFISKGFQEEHGRVDMEHLAQENARFLEMLRSARAARAMQEEEEQDRQSGAGSADDDGPGSANETEAAGEEAERPEPDHGASDRQEQRKNARGKRERRKSALEAEMVDLPKGWSQAAFRVAGVQPGRDMAIFRAALVEKILSGDLRRARPGESPDEYMQHVVEVRSSRSPDPQGQQQQPSADGANA